MKIAITGANGFIGSYLRRELDKKGIEFSILDRNIHNLLQPETLKEFVEGKDIIVHLAGINKDQGIEEIIKTNVLGTKGLLEAVSKYNPTVKIIFASSCLVYVKEDVFGVTKKIGEDLIRNYSKFSQIKAILLRFSNIYGKGCKPYKNSVIATFAEQIKKNIPLSINGDGKQKRDFLYIEDAIDAIMKSIAYNPGSVQYFDICTGKFTSLNEVIGILGRLSKKKIEVVYNINIRAGHNIFKKTFMKAKNKIYWKPTVSLLEGLEILVKNI